MRTLRDILLMPGPRTVDIDDVTIPLKEHVVSSVNKYFSSKLRRSFTERDYVFLGLEYSKILAESGITKDDKMMLFRYMERDKIIENIMPKVYSIASLNILSLYGPNTYTTSRGNGYYDDAISMTARWQENVKKQDKCYEPIEVIFNHNKEEAVMERGFNYLIDDNPDSALTVLRKNVPVIMFNQSWNRLGFNDKNIILPEAYRMKELMIKELEPYENKLLFRVDSWFDIFKELVQK